MRVVALEWWKTLTEEQKIDQVRAWQKETGDWRKHWDIPIIMMSDSTIEQIFREKRKSI